MPFKFINNQTTRQFSENFFSAASQRLEFSVCLCLYFDDYHDIARHLQVPPQLSIGDLKTCCHAAPGCQARGADCMPLPGQTKKTVIWTGRRVRGRRGANTVLWIVIFTGDHATMVLIITCELMQIQNTAPSHTQTSTDQPLVSLCLFKLKFDFGSCVTVREDGVGGNQVFQY